MSRDPLAAWVSAVAAEEPVDRAAVESEHIADVVAMYLMEDPVPRLVNVTVGVLD